MLTQSLQSFYVKMNEPWGKRPKSAGAKSSSCRFFFSAARNANTKATEYVTFGFFLYIGCFSFYESLNRTVCQRYGYFSVLAATIRERPINYLVLRIVKALLFTHQPDRVVPKVSDVSAADWLYQHTWKNIVTAFLRAGNPSITSQFMW